MHALHPSAVSEPQNFDQLATRCANLHLTTELTRSDCEDTFLAHCPPNVSLTHVSLAFFSATPKLVKWLLVLRNATTSAFGLNSTTRRGRPDLALLRSDSRIGLLEVGPILPHSAMIGADDAHRNFRLLQSQEDASLRCKNQVAFHNTLGRVYFFFVKLLHRWIVPRVLRSTARVFKHRLPSRARPPATWPRSTRRSLDRHMRPAIQIYISTSTFIRVLNR